MLKHCLYLFIALFSYGEASYSNQYLHIQTIASNLGVPWGMALMPDGSMLITEREGRLSRLNLKTGKITTISGLPPVKTGGQGGLFDVKLPPDYSKHNWIYFSYSKAVNNQGTTALARAKLRGNVLINWQDIFIAHARSKKAVHYGGRITFDNKQHIFLSIGDRGIRKHAQNLSNHAGSIVRLKFDGSAASDNPFINQSDALNEIWSYGHRNIQGLFFNTDNRQLWAVEHGPRGGDEINLITAGSNYGWPAISYGMEYWGPFAVGEDTERAGMEQPVKAYIPSIAPSSLIQYKGTYFNGWQTNLLVSALSSHLNQIVLNDNNQAITENRLLANINGRIRHVLESTEGWLYLSTDDGRILKITAR